MITKVTIKEFFNQPEVQKAVLNQNLDKVYEFWRVYSSSSVSVLTSFFLFANINPLEYMTVITNYMYWNLPIKNIIIPHSIINIRGSAFSNCSSLESVSIPNSVTEIDVYVFFNCISLKSIVLPNSITKINDCAFSNCISLRQITIPSSVKEIDTAAFNHCTSLESVTIPTSVTKIGEAAFYDCTSLKLVSIPKNCKVEDNTFDKTTKIERY
jgi:hypothetical protein